MSKTSQSAKPEELEKAQLLPVDQIAPNPHQPRSAISTDSIADLVASIKDVGIHQPLLVAKKDSRFILIAGHRLCSPLRYHRQPHPACLRKGGRRSRDPPLICVFVLNPVTALPPGLGKVRTSLKISTKHQIRGQDEREIS